MTSIWCVTWSDGYESGIVCDSHYSTEEKAREGLAQLRANVLAQTRKSAEEVLAEFKQGQIPWWHHDGVPEYEVSEAWVERRVAHDAEMFDREHAIEEQALDGFIPKLDGLP